MGVATTDNGKISIGDFRSNSEYIPYGAGDPTEDEQRIFRQWGPLNMSFDVRDLAVYPDTSRSAEGMRAIGSAHRGGVVPSWMVCLWSIQCSCKSW